MVPAENSIIELDAPMNQQLDLLGLPHEIEKFTIANEVVRTAVEELREHAGKDILQAVLQQ